MSRERVTPAVLIDVYPCSWDEELPDLCVGRRPLAARLRPPTPVTALRVVPGALRKKGQATA